MRIWKITILCVLALLLAPRPSEAQRNEGKRVSVAIQNSRYSPAKVSCKRGDTVVWTNNDDKDHTVVAADGSFSGSLKPGKSYSYTFRKAGDYTYACRLHPRMKGSVSVD